MAENEGNTAGDLQENENRSGEDHVEEEEARANREGQGATAGAAAAQMPARRFNYPEGMREKQKKIFKQETLMKNPEVLYEDVYETGTRCNLIFFTHSGDNFRDAIEAAYPGSTRIQMANKLKLELSDGSTVSVFPSGKILIQGNEENLETFEERFDQIRQDVERRREEQMMRRLEQMRIEESDSETEQQGEQKQSK